MSTRRRRLLGGIVVAALGVLGLFLWLLSPRLAIGPEGYDRIQLGMTAAEVEAILGGTPGNYGFPDPRVVQVRDDINVPRLAECRYVQWVGPHHMIGVQLDAADRVVGKDLGQVVGHGPWWWQPIRWLGL
jgi:hypothetical protein